MTLIDFAACALVLLVAATVVGIGGILPGVVRAALVATGRVVVEERVVYRTLPADVDTYITVIDVARGLGVEPEKDLMWAIGRQAARLHRTVYGCGPRKALREKTGGGGRHDFAVYPPEMRWDLEGLFRIRAEAARMSPV